MIAVLLIAFLILLEPAVMLYVWHVAKKRGWLWTGH